MIDHADGHRVGQKTQAADETTDTVKAHVSWTIDKLGLRDRVQAVILAYESGIVRVGENHPKKSVNLLAHPEHLKT